MRGLLVVILVVRSRLDSWLHCFESCVGAERRGEKVLRSCGYEFGWELLYLCYDAVFLLVGGWRRVDTRQDRLVCRTQRWKDVGRERGAFVYGFERNMKL